MADYHHGPLATLRAEHASLQAVVGCLTHAADSAGPSARMPGLKPGPIVAFIDGFEQRIHGPKEDSHLYLVLAQRAPLALPVVARCRQARAAQADAIRALEQLLLEGGAGGMPEPAAPFARTVEDLARSVSAHISIEEGELFPLALQVLGRSDWRELDAAFASRIDPLANLGRDGGPAGLLHRIDRALAALEGLAAHGRA